MITPEQKNWMAPYVAEAETNSKFAESVTKEAVWACAQSGRDLSIVEIIMAHYQRRFNAQQLIANILCCHSINGKDVIEKAYATTK
ncbi:MAG: hypothetical protein OSB62_00155 [Alphaproteobacteria bacterium]|nr:hypothetical protein [Alphaproteobacteria bacterium]